jgi:hypothetical protein
VNEFEGKVVGLLERVAVAQEELNSLARGETETAMFLPGVCPHCNTTNPRIVNDRGGDGLMSEFVLVAKCQHCDKTLYALAQGWVSLGTAEEVRQLQEGGK